MIYQDFVGLTCKSHAGWPFYRLDSLEQWGVSKIILEGELGLNERRSFLALSWYRMYSAFSFREIYFDGQYKMMFDNMGPANLSETLNNAVNQNGTGKNRTHPIFDTINKSARESDCQKSGCIRNYASKLERFRFWGSHSSRKTPTICSKDIQKLSRLTVTFIRISLKACIFLLYS